MAPAQLTHRDLRVENRLLGQSRSDGWTANRRRRRLGLDGSQPQEDNCGMSRDASETLPPPRLGDRAWFPHLDAVAYCNHAAISPVSTAVFRAVSCLLDDYSRKGTGAYLTWHRQRLSLKRQLGQLINAQADDIALISNTTRGVTDVALCLPWNRGDHVVVFQGEFPGNVTPWQRAAELHGLELSFLPATDFELDPEAALNRLERVLARGVRLLAVSSVQFQTGLRMPMERIGELCRAHTAELFVDAIQGCGAVPIDVAKWQADYLTCGSHKWLMGTEGAGFLYVNAARAAALRPHVAGWLSHENAESFLFEGPGHLRYDRPLRAGPAIFEGGTTNAAGFAALGASVSALLELGVARIHAHVNHYLDTLETELVERGFRSLRAPEKDRRSCILAVMPPRNVSVVALRAQLLGRGVVCAVPDGNLRFAPHWPNSLDEIPRLLRAVDDSLVALR